MNITAGDERFEIIAKAKEDLIRSTNIETSEDEMKVLDSFLFRCWQMGWLNGYETTGRNGKALLVVDISTCEECPCYHEDRAVCQAGGLYGKPCPLRPLPKKKTEEEEMAKDPFNEDLFYDEYIWGWNDCLSEITGETK